ncbi:hypothetical protein COCNU_04G010980 [Cocos nucifera]|uniref:Uncharacterized protein n=1 Tax=Cocos nucifera TaxID=13894 RepID=A0A8K0I774_COCNU|nr:hypothetical protein COCNU_04G010980 [Cocos nucifera]
MAPPSSPPPIQALQLRSDPREKPDWEVEEEEEEEEEGRCASLVVLLCPCLVLLILLLIVGSIVLAVKLRLFCRGPFRASLGHLFYKEKCRS